MSSDSSTPAFTTLPATDAGPQSPSPTTSHKRRTLSSSSSIRDLDLNYPSNSALARRYPAPPTGHELMAMFPPASPSQHTRPEPTSEFFKNQEREFFAHPGKEIIIVDVDMPRKDERRARPSLQRPSPIPNLPNPAESRSARPHVRIPHAPPPLGLSVMAPPSGRAASPQESGLDMRAQDDDMDGSWSASGAPERRRAGKHTRRVIVRN